MTDDLLDIQDSNRIFFPNREVDQFAIGRDIAHCCNNRGRPGYGKVRQFRKVAGRRFEIENAHNIVVDVEGKQTIAYDARELKDYFGVFRRGSADQGRHQSGARGMGYIENEEIVTLTYQNQILPVGAYIHGELERKHPESGGR